MLYLANCSVKFSYYQGKDETKEINHIIEANSEEEAKDKIDKYYDLKDDSYYLTHYVQINYINELIK